MPESGVDLQEPASFGSTPLEVVVMSRLNQSPILPKLVDLSERTPVLTNFRENGGLDRTAVTELFGLHEIADYRERIKARDTGMRLIGEEVIDGSNVTLYEGKVQLQTGLRNVAQLCVVEDPDGKLTTFTLFKKDEEKIEGKSLASKIESLQDSELAETLLKIQEADEAGKVKIDLSAYEGLVAAEWASDNTYVDILALHEPFTEFGRTLQYEVYQTPDTSVIRIRSLLYESSQNKDKETEQRVRSYLDKAEGKGKYSDIETILKEIREEHEAIEARGDKPVPFVPDLFVRLDNNGKVLEQKLEEFSEEVSEIDVVENSTSLEQNDSDGK